MGYAPDASASIGDTWLDCGLVEVGELVESFSWLTCSAESGSIASDAPGSLLFVEGTTITLTAGREAFEVLGAGSRLLLY